MLAKAKKHVDRAGHRPVHVHCVLVINSVYLPDCCTVQDQSILNISFVKGSKTSSTNNFINDKSRNSGENEILVKERLELSLVLYKDARSSIYQKKSSKLILRQLSKQGILGKFSYKVIGKCNLQLDEIANGMGYELSKTKNGTVIFENLDGAMVRFSINLTFLKMESTSRYLRSGEDNLSTTSSVSELTEATTSAANACYSASDLQDYDVPSSHPTFTTTADQETTLDQYPTSYSAPVHAPGWSAYENVIPEEEEEAKSSEASSEGQKSPDSHPPAAQEAAAAADADNKTPSPTMDTVMLTAATMSLTGDEVTDNENSAESFQTAPQGSAEPTAVATPTAAAIAGAGAGGADGAAVDPSADGSPSLQEGTVSEEQLQFMRQQRSSAPSTLEAFILYDTELEARARLIAQLEAALAAHLRESHEQLLDMHSELRESSAALQRERIARETIVEATLMGDQQLLSALAEARQEAGSASAQCTAALADLAEVCGELQQCREQVAALQGRIEEEMALTQRAASVAASASMQRAEVEDENRRLLGMLIELKMNCANGSAELDRLRKGIADLERRLARAERVSGGDP